MSISSSGSDRVYCYPGTNVLKNKLNIRDGKTLSDFERRVSSASTFELMNNPVKGDFDFKHLCAIHKGIFNELYDWAGKVRTVDIAKNEMFCKVEHLHSYGNDIFEKLRRENFLIGMDKENAIGKLSEYFGDINALHPFREGNGRTQRQFISNLAKATGFNLHFSKTNAEEMLNASRSSFYCDYEPFKKIFNEIAEPISLSEQREFLRSVSSSAYKVFEDLSNKDLVTDRLVEGEKEFLPNDPSKQEMDLGEGFSLESWSEKADLRKDSIATPRFGEAELGIEKGGDILDR